MLATRPPATPAVIWELPCPATLLDVEADDEDWKRTRVRRGVRLTRTDRASTVRVVGRAAFIVICIDLGDLKKRRVDRDDDAFRSKSSGVGRY